MQLCTAYNPLSADNILALLVTKSGKRQRSSAADFLNN